MSTLLLRTRAQLAGLDSLRGGRPLVLVPTMGALHEGHLSLVDCGSRLGPVVVSIFVNPTQFGPEEDLDAYPRDLAGDLALLEGRKVAAVFAPDVADMYGEAGEVSVAPGRRAAGLCGAARPDHFRGVLTVVAKLFGLVRPDVAVFGRKDAQQCLVIDQMVRDLCLPVRLIDAPTIRESDGLAMSSRNRYLQGSDRGRALCLRRALDRGRTLLTDGVRDGGKLEEAMAAELAAADRPDYAVVRTVPELAVPDVVAGRVLLAVAAQVGPARLIDNVVLDVAEDRVRESALLDELPAHAARSKRN
ncbi:pantoate--beta-alanine ligase [bacterium CG17_big_fil_post_rev_8_21_14_2_50_64_8]|nr:MAG: pantoate--beta-alanine ligase [bacterium CG17_big_fil_post_rev_8_21_14_2_50_64_8]PJA76213.1 MAG: pantoate--beta-alanine ligase [bacterium CG_4_9_14_3_um_filter_65_15]